jgi:uncharacterized coiled-coil protein SlyX
MNTNMKTTTPLIRNSIDGPFLRSSFILIGLALGCFALCQTAQAVGPDTDGTIPGANNGEGVGVLVSRTTGVWNTGTGLEALNHLTAGNQNTATGLRALFSDTNGGFNTATGVYSLFSNTSGFFNSATGAYSLAHNTIGNYNTANGYGALYFNTEGDANTANGFAALYKNTTGTQNTAIGQLALNRNTTGSINTAVGFNALFNNTTGNNNIVLGAAAGGSITTASNVICIGTNLSVQNVSDSCFIANIRGTTTAAMDAIPVVIDSFGQLGTNSSSRRFKNDIKPMDRTSEALLALKPVTFHYKSDNAGTPQFGLIAEEVAEVNPDLVVRDENGEIYTVRYDAVNAMLLNEFLKEHRKVQEQDATIARVKSTAAKQEATIAQQQKQIEALTAGLQKVSAQIEASKPAPQIVLNNQ